MSKSNLYGSLFGLLGSLVLTFASVKDGMLTAIVHAIHIPLTWIGMIFGIVIASLINVYVTHRLEKK